MLCPKCGWLTPPSSIRQYGMCKNCHEQEKK